jgi:hypothetical protein
VHQRLEEEARLLDALAPIYDQLSLAPFWWMLELFPIRQHYQEDDNTRVQKQHGIGEAYSEAEEGYDQNSPDEDGGAVSRWEEVCAQGIVRQGPSAWKCCLG